MKKLLISLLCVLMLTVPLFAQAQTACGSMTAVIDGEEYVFTLDSAQIYGSSNTMVVSYECRDPRGDMVYSITLFINKRVKPGTYTSGAKVSLYDPTVRPVSQAYFEAGDAGDYTVGKRQTSAYGSYSLTILSRSDDWSTYTGTVTAVLVSAKGTRVIEDAQFSFTLQ